MARSSSVPFVLAAAALAAVGWFALSGGSPAPRTPTPGAKPPSAPPNSPPSPPPAPVPTPPAPSVPAPAPVAEAPGTTHRWYEHLQEGAKAGWLHVVWSPSTWEGRATVRDVTTATSRSTRRMLGTEDVFESRSVTTTERGTDGVLFSQSTRSTERGGRVTLGSIRWTGAGYDEETRIEGEDRDGAATERRHVAATEPAHVDAEAMLSARASTSGLVVGERFVRRQVNPRAGKLEERPIRVVAEEELDGPAGKARVWRVEESDPATDGTTTLWIDRDGALVRLKELSTEIRRVADRSEAEKERGPGASFSITAKAVPVVQRIFSADVFEVDVAVAPDPDRPRPDIPDSPWSRITSVEGDDARGVTLRARLTSYNVPGASATLPVTDPGFAPYLEPTALMPCRHPDVKAAAARAVAGETNARRAAQRIADFVYTLDKESPEVAEASALEILRDRKGDCSEHALLFVALCRAAGIPARRCSGFVCVGSDWGSHAWAEIWVGAWIGVDPTTNDVGTAARYLFFGYEDAADARLGTTSARARGRLSFRGVSLDGDGEHVDLTAPSLRAFDEATGRLTDRTSGLELTGLPKGTRATFGRGDTVELELPGGVSASIFVMADQGLRTPAHWAKMFGGRSTVFAGRPASARRAGSTWLIVTGARKRVVRIVLSGTGSGDALDAASATLAAAMAPTFEERAVGGK